MDKESFFITDRSHDVLKPRARHSLSGIPFPEKPYCSPFRSTIKRSHLTRVDLEATLVEAGHSLIPDYVFNLYAQSTRKKKRDVNVSCEEEISEIVRFPDYVFEEGFPTEDVA